MKVKYDVKGVDPGGERELPKPGVHRCKVISCVWNEKPASGKPARFEIQYQITEGDAKGYVLYDYINPNDDNVLWKMAQFVQAMGLPPKGSIDPNEIVGTALSIRVRIQPGNEQYAPKAVPGTLIPLDGENDEEELDEPDDEDDEDEEEEAEDAEESEDDDEWDEESLSEEDDDSLREIAGELEVDPDEYSKTTGKGKKKKTTLDRDGLIAAILEAQDEDEDEDAEEESDEDEDELWTREELEALSSADLREAAEEAGVDVPSGKVTAKRKEALIAGILESQEEDDEDDEDEEEEAEDEAPNYDDMDLDDLRAEAKKRKLNTKGSKKAMIARLQKDDKPF